MMSLEDQLVTGMREATTGLVPRPDLIDRAARANRRRRTRFAVVASGLSVVSVLAVVYAIAGTPTAAPRHPAASPSAALSPNEIALRAAALLGGEIVEHVRYEAHFTKSPDQAAGEYWFDTATGDSRIFQNPDAAARGHGTESWTVHHADGTVTVSYIDHDARIWSSEKQANQATGTTMPWLPAQLRTKLSGDLQPMGAEAVRDRPAFRFRLRINQVWEDLWVDTATFQVLRLQITPAVPDNTNLGDRIVTMDFDWSTRTPEALQPLTFAPPAGYRKVNPS